MFKQFDNYSKLCCKSFVLIALRYLLYKICFIKQLSGNINARS